jgi:hypothetical protein
MPLPGVWQLLNLSAQHKVMHHLLTERLEIILAQRVGAAQMPAIAQTPLPAGAVA